MDFTKATKQQLLQIAQSEDCPLEYKYRACSELQRRQRDKEDFSPQIVYMFGKGLMVSEIADNLLISRKKVEKVIDQFGLWKTRLQMELRNKKPFNRGAACAFYKGKRAAY